MPSAVRVGRWQRFESLLATPVSGASLAAFRIAVGLVMVLEAISLCRPYLTAVRTGPTPLEAYYTGANIHFHFPYEAFQWLPLFSPPWIYAILGLQMLAGVTMSLGLWYRASVTTVFFTWGYLFVVESTRTYWQSHYYLEELLAFLMIWMPAARCYSVDAWLARHKDQPRTVPFWAIALLRGQLVIAYFYAGAAKINADWLLDAMPVRWFLQRAHVTAPYEPYLSTTHLEAFSRLVHSTGFAFFISYTGLIFDLAVGFLLLIRRTRIFALILMVTFHITNHLLIFDDIGWFPLVGILTALIFLDPDWPERIWHWLRHPRLARPDWIWFIAGGVVIPIVGATLGWKLKPSPPSAKASLPHRLGRATAPFVIAWLVWQTLLPVRHFFIPGDARITYEGLSFSWRLKTEVHSSLYARISVEDPAIILADDPDHTRINWNEWHGDRVIYRTLTPGRIKWSQLPEIVVLLEPLLGERIIYNPYAATNGLGSDPALLARLKPAWQRLYGRDPERVERTLPISQVLGSISELLRAGGNTPEATMLAGLAARSTRLERNELRPQDAERLRDEILGTLIKLRARDENGAMIPLLRRLSPFALGGERTPPVPFFSIEDPLLFDAPAGQLPTVARKLWKAGDETRSERSRTEASEGVEALIVYTGHVGELAITGWSILPQFCIFDSQDRPKEAPYIFWNSLRDLPISKLLHVSNQAFFLRRYARRIASLWEKEYGHRPAVHAITAVSLNGRPYQALVDPKTDLASVSVKWFGHNDWVNDLQTPRIPARAFSQGREFMGQ